MLKLVVLAALVACAVAGQHGLIAPVVAAPAVAVPLATSYHNTFRAPVVKAAPVIAAPVAVAHAAPVVAAAPVAVAHAVPVAPLIKTIAPAPLIIKPAAHVAYVH